MNGVKRSHQDGLEKCGIAQAQDPGVDWNQPDPVDGFLSSADLDSSAILKLVVSEPESKALFDLLTDWPIRVSSELARTETLRALRRAGARVLERNRPFTTVPGEVRRALWTRALTTGRVAVPAPAGHPAPGSDGPV